MDIGAFEKEDVLRANAVRNGKFLDQTLSASVWGGILLVVINAMILLLGGYDGPFTWMIVIIYFTICHSTLILLGMLGLAKALAGKCYRYPLIGFRLPDGCRSLR